MSRKSEWQWIQNIGIACKYLCGYCLPCLVRFIVRIQSQTRRTKRCRNRDFGKPRSTDIVKVSDRTKKVSWGKVSIIPKEISAAKETFYAHPWGKRTDGASWASLLLHQRLHIVWGVRASSVPVMESLLSKASFPGTSVRSREVPAATVQKDQAISWLESKFYNTQVTLDLQACRTQE